MKRCLFAGVRHALPLLALLVAGCGRRVELVPVEGQVTLDGRPLSAGSIMLQPVAGPAARGRIDGEGRFRMGTYRRGDGVIAGRAAVRVASFENSASTAPGAEPTLGKSLLPERYADFGTSGITVEVTRGMGPVTVELSSD